MVSEGMMALVWFTLNIPLRIAISTIWIMGLLCAGGSAYGQKQYTIRHYTNENGLPAQSIKGIALDKKNGFLWIGTQAGLVRFDGRRFRDFNLSDGLATASRIGFIARNKAGEIYCEDDRFSIHRIGNDRPEFLMTDSFFRNAFSVSGGRFEPHAARRVAAWLRAHPWFPYLPNLIAFEGKKTDQPDYSFIYFGQVCHYSAKEDSLRFFNDPGFRQIIRLGGKTYFVRFNQELWWYSSKEQNLVRKPVKGMPAWHVIGGTTVTPGNNTTTLTLSGYTGTVLSWQSSTDGFNTDIVNIDNHSNQLTVTNISQTTAFRALLQHGDCSPAFSTPATLSISTLPIRVGSLKAQRENGGIRVQWVAYNLANTERFEIERSADGQQFKMIAVLTASGAEGDVPYQWLDAQPLPGKNFYRLKEVYRSGKTERSNIVHALYESSQPTVAAYPNPVVNNKLTLEFRNMKASQYRIGLLNNAGQHVYNSIITHGGGYRAYTLALPSGIARGLYRLVITSADGSIRNSQSLLVQ